MADPVRMLLLRHRKLCERAVDPLDIAAGLETYGITDRTAARFRHRDVFSLAEELYARVPRPAEGAAGPPAPAVSVPVPAPGSEATWRRYAWVLLALLPGAVCAAALAGAAVTDGAVRTAVGVAGAVGAAAALAGCLRRGPLRPRARRTVPGLRAWPGLLLLAYAAYGDGLLAALLRGGPDEPWPPAPAPLVGLAFAVAPAVWCARFFAVRARRRLAAGRTLRDVAAAVRPLLALVVVLYAVALVALLPAAGAAVAAAWPAGSDSSGGGVGGGLGGWGAFGGVSGFLAAVALGVLLFAARLLTVHGFPEPAAAGLLGACAAEALAPASLLAGRLPGCDVLARPVEAAVVAWGTGAVPALACGVAALALLARAAAVLGRASAHVAP
ncbi:hypothetical protein AB0A69_13225 [Streptomyces sp. NPDC045431]|uniref:hypothetical protein n=1 Tax=Streptomyces sp. NPDC045431 TaxID=3155613 RepID=UPI0033E25DA2